MNVKNVDASNYNQFYSKTQEMIIGPMLLPIKWKDELWGLLMYQDEVLVGGWIGNKRIKHSFISKIYQEVVFHSQPQLFVAVNQEDIDLLVDSLIEKAKQENIS